MATSKFGPDALPQGNTSEFSLSLTCNLTGLSDEQRGAISMILLAAVAVDKNLVAWKSVANQIVG